MVGGEDATVPAPTDIIFLPVGAHPNEREAYTSLNDYVLVRCVFGFVSVLGF